MSELLSDDFLKEQREHLTEVGVYKPFEYIFSPMFAEQLQEKMKRKPLTRNSLEVFLKNISVRILRRQIFYSGERLPTGVDRFNIYITKECSPTEALLIATHEIIHVFYKVIPPHHSRYGKPKENDRTEELIESEAARFLSFSENREYLRNLLENSSE